LRGAKLEEAIWADVSALLAEPRRIEEEYQRRLSIGEESADASASQRQLQMQAVRVRRQISKLIDAYGEGLIEKQEFEPRIRDARAQLERLQAEARGQEQLQAQLQEMRQFIGQLEAFAKQVRGKLHTADWTMRRQLITTLVKRVEIGAEEVRVVYRVDCGPFELAPFGGLAQDCWRRRRATGRGISRPTVCQGRTGPWPNTSGAASFLPWDTRVMPPKTHRELLLSQQLVTRSNAN
jgi:site-specific DNA recombinase